MCKFFSFTTKGDGVPIFFGFKERTLITEGKLEYSQDSHTSINDFFGLKGSAEDKTNKYEYLFGKDEFIIDQKNAPVDDSEQMKKWVRKFIKTKEFLNILSVVGDLDPGGCDLKGIMLPTTIGGSLYPGGCVNIPNKLPKVKGNIYK